MDTALISSSAGILAVLATIASVFFYLENRTNWQIFSYFPPLLFIYLVPVVLSNLSFIPNQSPLYGYFRSDVLPVFLIIMLLRVDLFRTFRVMGRGLGVMLLGTLGVMIGAPVAYWLVSGQLEPEMWKGFGALAGSWIGGTGNMTAVADMVGLDDSGAAFSYAVIADNAVYLVWLPIMLASRNFAGWFHRFSRMPDSRLEQLETAASSLTSKEEKPQMRHLLYLLGLGFGGASLAAWLGPQLPEVKLWTGDVFLNAAVYRILLVTTIGILLSFTPASRIPGSHQLAMALIYLYVARMGATADLSSISGSVIWFLLGSFIWISIHGALILVGSRLFKIDVHTAAIASAANIGGAASAPIVAAYHKPSLVPVSILMAMVGYAVGTQAAYITAKMCQLVGH